MEYLLYFRLLHVTLVHQFHHLLLQPFFLSLDLSQFTPDPPGILLHALCMPLQLPIAFLKVYVDCLQGFELRGQFLGLPLEFLEVPCLLIKGGLHIFQLSQGVLQALVGLV